jgi:plasmid stability protein
MSGSTPDAKLAARDIDSGRDRRLRIPIAAHPPHRVLDGQERDVLRYLLEENRVLRCQLWGRRLQLTDDDRSRLAVRAYRLGPWTAARDRGCRDAGHAASLASAALRPEVDVYQTLRDSSWSADGDSASDGKDGGRESHLGLHANPRRIEERRASRGPSTNARVLKAAGVPNQPERPTS